MHCCVSSFASLCCDSEGARGAAAAGAPRLRCAACCCMRGCVLPCGLSRSVSVAVVCFALLLLLLLCCGSASLPCLSSCVVCFALACALQPRCRPSSPLVRLVCSCCLPRRRASFCLRNTRRANNSTQNSTRSDTYKGLHGGHSRMSRGAEELRLFSKVQATRRLPSFARIGRACKRE